MLSENSILVDWFSATTKIYDPVSLMYYLGLNIDSFESLSGFYGYRERYYFGGISIHYDKRGEEECKEQSVLLEMSGQGCRQFETSSSVGFGQLFADVEHKDFHINRVDIAYDDIDKSEGGSGLIDIVKLARYTIHQRFVSKWQGGTVTDSFKINGNNEPMIHALTVQFGSNKSDIKLRIYDKAQERGGLGYHWVRAEIVFRDERAAGFIHELMQGAPIGKLYGGVLRNYLRFIRSDATRRERCSTVGWWDKFLDGCEAVRIFTPKDVDYNLARIRHYVTHQAGNSIDTYIQCVGVDNFLNDIKHRDSVITPEQQRVIREYKAEVAQLYQSNEKDNS